MRAFGWTSAQSLDEAIQAAAGREAQVLAGGTTLVDLLKLEVFSPAQVVDLNGAALRQGPLGKIEVDGHGLRIGALVTNTALADHAEVKARWPVLSEAILAGASPQLRNMATVGGNLLQRTRCSYFRDGATRCNKRAPGTGCDALEGVNRMHAILGTSEQCIAAHPSDMCVALAALDATVHVRGPSGERDIPFGEFHLLPEHPEREFALQPGELITSVFVPDAPFAKSSRYVKVRDRAAYAFALTSCAAALDAPSGRIRSARVALGGVGTKPWRAPQVEKALEGKVASRQVFEEVAALAFEGAKPRLHNGFKVELGKRTMVRALSLAAGLREGDRRSGPAAPADAGPAKETP